MLRSQHPDEIRATSRRAVCRSRDELCRDVGTDRVEEEEVVSVGLFRVSQER
jgi:hypothetical protein